MCMRLSFARLEGAAMKTKLFLTISSLCLGVWLGAGFIASADPADLDHGLVPPGHGDSHRLGVVEGTEVALPKWDGPRIGDWSPLLLAAAE